MIDILDHNIISSFKEFLQYKILRELSAFKNVSSSLTLYNSPRSISGKQSYSSNYAQWVYDSSIPTAQIPSGIDGLSRSESGLSFDFKNGRIFVDSGVPITGSLNLTVPDFNIYTTTSSVNKIVLENKFRYRPDLNSNSVLPDSIIAPCIIISFNSSTDKEIFISGPSESKFDINICVLSDNLYKTFGIQKIIRDIKHETFPLLSLTPFNELNDLKEEYWNYTWVQDWLGNQDNLVFVDDSYFKMIELDSVNEKHPLLHIGFGSVSLLKYRMSSNLTDINYTIPYAINSKEFIYANQDQVYIIP